MFTLKLLAALACMGTVLWFSVGDFAWWTTASTAARAGRLSGIVLLGAGSYFLALWLLGFRIAHFSRRVAH